ncbi:MAG: Na+/H+ antiporter subunit E [Rhodopseudomonas sp.]|uniref:Na+/H+ antiporter subunit E n=1 Tax=unclassified Rhodopseudomonas TaxID=2638247 RepID=UPI0013DED71A|nr:Na+/H+ antiporter subunit E [Rhodopseudomonas sp. BR0M22]MCD0421636.1 Na+/H+ antiporter subunit E [Rubrivivax sp. JA1024]NEW90358.1 Na+/H+ antiporter subunit E [Rhodopseudomonas sp. BR0M22]
MTRLLPFPLISLCLLAMWLWLSQSLSLGPILLGSLFALMGGWLLRLLQSDADRVRNPSAIIQLAGLVLIDVIRSNIAVGSIILGGQRNNITSGFVDIPLDLRSRQGLAVLACIITSTPGTLWVNFTRETGVLQLHVLDLVDESEWVERIKGRYERRLLEIFE